MVQDWFIRADRASRFWLSAHPDQIASARSGHDAWWQARGWMQDGLIAGVMQREVKVSGAMLQVRLWK